MTHSEWLEEVLALPDIAAQKRLLGEHSDQLDDEVADVLKQRSHQLIRADIQQSLQLADLLLYLGELTVNPFHTVLGLLAHGNARCIGLGEYQRAIEYYTEAADICRAQGDVVTEARVQIGLIWALACQGRYQEAVKTGEWVIDVLETHGEWQMATQAIMNLAIVHGRQGQDRGALSMFDRARDLNLGLGPDSESILPLIEQNRSIVLRNLGRFDESIAASQTAWAALAQLSQTVEAARAQQNLAITYFVLGRYNEALRLLNEAREVFLSDERIRDALLIELFISDCLLQLRRFTDVLDKCRRARELFAGLGANLEVGQTILNEAIAYAGLGRYEEAMTSLEEARRYFAEERNDVWVATADLERAAILLRQGAHDTSRAALQASADVFRDHGLLVKEAQAELIAARVASALGHTNQAIDLVHRALLLGESKGIPSLTYACHHLLGSISQSQGDDQDALTEYQRAASELEQLRGRLMIEFRAEFLEDKQVLYEDIVHLCLNLDQPNKGLEYAERAKSRALLDLLAYRLDLSVQARSEEDAPLVHKLVQLRAERDQIYRRWETDEKIPVRGGQQEVQQDVIALENQITDLWHQLLIRNADYARDAALWHVRTEPIQPYLDDDTLVLEYFIAHQKLVAFTITSEAVQAQFLPGDLSATQRLLQRLWLNLRTVPSSSPPQVPRLAENARKVLQRLDELVLAPLRDNLAPYRRVIIVPHGPLHYLPFHALHDGNAYLVEQFEVSYLPAASLLRYCSEARHTTSGLAAFGYSVGGRLPYAVQEARAIAQLMPGRAYLGDEVTSSRLKETIGDCRLVHLATHGDFRPDNPLFSGLALADGFLTTLDIFNLRLDASLVTLSACQTGRNVVGGGDELLGLMRAFLYAGAASLTLSLWSVEDRSTWQIMERFYHKLADGWTKAAALRDAQLYMCQNQGQDAVTGAYAHPYFWAPFFLVGHPGPL